MGPLYRLVIEGFVVLVRHRLMFAFANSSAVLQSLAGQYKKKEGTWAFRRNPNWRASLRQYCGSTQLQN